MDYLNKVESFSCSEYVQPNIGWVKLNANESSYAPSPKVNKALHQLLENGASLLRLYPSPYNQKLEGAIAALHNLATQQVLVGHGTEALLSALFKIFTPSKVGIYSPAYPLYSFLSQGHDIDIEFIDLLPGFDPQLETLKKKKYSLLFLSSPHWPTGYHFSKELIISILESFSGILVLDEAYAGFCAEDRVNLIDTYPNLLILKTFSKHYALAGLRVAYALGAQAIIEQMQKVLPAYNLSSMAQVATLAALQDPLYYQEKIQQVIVRRAQFCEFLDSLGWFHYPSEANFILFKPQNQSLNSCASALYHYLKDYKILLRNFEDVLTEPYLRISIAASAEMKIASTAIENFSKSLY